MNKDYVKISEIISKLREDEVNFYTEREVIKENINHESSELLTFYTDGCAKGVSEDGERGFGGYGWVAKTQDGERRYGFSGRDNIDSDYAELLAIESCLKQITRKSSVTIVSDSLNSIRLLCNIEKSLRIYNGQASREDLESTDSNLKRRATKYGKILEHINCLIKQNEQIKELSVRWVRSHLLDCGYNNVIIDIHNLSKEDEEIANMITGNHIADRHANRGVDYILRKYCQKLFSKNPSSYYQNTFTLSEEVFQKGVNNSLYCRMKCVDFMIKSGLDNFEEKKIRESLGFEAWVSAVKADILYKNELVFKEQGIYTDMSEYYETLNINTSNTRIDGHYDFKYNPENILDKSYTLRPYKKYERRNPLINDDLSITKSEDIGRANRRGSGDLMMER